MEREKRGRAWLWILILLILAGAAFYLYTQLGSEPPEPLIAEKAPPAKESPEVAPPPQQEVEKPVSSPEAKPEGLEPLEGEEAPGAAQIDCARVEEEVLEFFSYLDERDYLQELDPELDTHSRARRMVTELSAKPPVPAGEGVDHRIMLGNLYHFFRVLSRKDLQLIKRVLQHEQDAVEFNLKRFYPWMTAGDRCSDLQGVRPDFDVLYRYAGFFLNTTGGRAYLFRRATGIRLMVSYYCLKIIHEADREGKNTYGIDALGFIDPLREEIIHYPDLQFQREYVADLNRMEAYYQLRR